VQEVARSRVAVVICGTYCVAWDRFARWPFRAVPRIAASLKQPKTSIRNSSKSRQNSIFQPKADKEFPGILNYASGHTPSTGSDSLPQILHEYRSAHASNPSDKVFGILGLMADITPYGHLIDYNKPTADIYVAVAWQILKDTQSLRILSAAGLPRGKPIQYFPSWVPDWSQATSEAPFGLGKTFAEPFNAGGRSCKLQEDSSGIKLKTEGVRIAMVTAPGRKAELDQEGRIDRKIFESRYDLFEPICDTRGNTLVSLYQAAVKMHHNTNTTNAEIFHAYSTFPTRHTVLESPC
jgi:hypothetical protein